MSKKSKTSKFLEDTSAFIAKMLDSESFLHDYAEKRTNAAEPLTDVKHSPFKTGAEVAAEMGDPQWSKR